MSATYYFIKDKKSKAPYFNLKDKLDYGKWVEVMEEYNITWDIDTNHGKYYLSKDPGLHYKKQAYFEYEEIKEKINYGPKVQVLKTGSYAFFIAFDIERGIAFSQFYKRELKEWLPLLFEISSKLECYLIINTKKIITKNFFENC